MIYLKKIYLITGTLTFSFSYYRKNLYIEYYKYFLYKENNGLNIEYYKKNRHKLMNYAESKVFKIRF